MMINHPYYFIDWKTSKYVVIWVNPKSKDPSLEADSLACDYSKISKSKSFNPDMTNYDILDYEEFFTYKDELTEYDILGDSDKYENGVFCGECDEVVKAIKECYDDDEESNSSYEVLSPCHECEVYSHREWDYDNHYWIYLQSDVIRSVGD
jgi:hypothetical protein